MIQTDHTSNMVRRNGEIGWEGAPYGRTGSAVLKPLPLKGAEGAEIADHRAATPSHTSGGHETAL